MVIVILFAYLNFSSASSNDLQHELALITVSVFAVNHCVNLRRSEAKSLERK